MHDVQHVSIDIARRPTEVTEVYDLKALQDLLERKASS